MFIIYHLQCQCSQKPAKNNRNNAKNVNLPYQLFSPRATYIKRDALVVCFGIKSKVDMMYRLFTINYESEDPLFSNKYMLINIKERY